MKLSIKTGRIIISCAAILAIILPASSQQPPQPPQLERVEGYLSKPASVKFNESLLKQLTMPAGFQVNVFAKDLGNARNLAVAPDGTVYLTRREEGDILALKDTNKD